MNPQLISPNDKSTGIAGSQLYTRRWIFENLEIRKIRTTWRADFRVERLERSGDTSRRKSSSQRYVKLCIFPSSFPSSSSFFFLFFFHLFSLSGRAMFAQLLVAFRRCLRTPGGAPRRLYTAATNLEDPETELRRLRDV